MDNVSQDEERKIEDEKHHPYKNKKYFGFNLKNSHISTDPKYFKKSVYKNYKNKRG